MAELKNKDFGIETGNDYFDNEDNMNDVATPEVTDVEYTPEENKEHIRMNEDDLIAGLIAASNFEEDDSEQKTVEIARKINGESKVMFKFNIRPLREDQYDKARKKHTKYVRNKTYGMKTPQEVDSVRYRANLIYMATIDDDRAKLWDNKKVQEALLKKGLPVANGLDVIEYSLKAGEKDRIVDLIDQISGYDANLEEVAKN